MSEAEVKQLIGVPVLSTVPDVQSQRAVFIAGEGKDAPDEDYHLFVDAFRRLRVELQMISDEIPLRRILIASALPLEGKSTVTFNLGLAFGEVGKRVIIADADFHRPTLHRIANAPARKGFTDLLAGTRRSRIRSSLSDNVHCFEGSALSGAARSGLGTERLARILGDMADDGDMYCWTPLRSCDSGQPIHGSGRGRNSSGGEGR